MSASAGWRWLVALATAVALAACAALAGAGSGPIGSAAVLLALLVAARRLRRRPLWASRPSARLGVGISPAIELASALLLPLPIAVLLVVAAYLPEGVSSSGWRKCLANASRGVLAVSAARTMLVVSGWIPLAVLAYALVDTLSMPLVVRARGQRLVEQWLRLERPVAAYEAALWLLGVLLATVWPEGPSVASVLIVLVVLHLAIQQQADLTVRTADALRRLISIVEGYDPYSRGHCERVGAYAAELAIAAGESSDMADLCYLAGTLHDLGKCAISIDTITAPRALTADEFETLKEHARHGGQMLAELAATHPFGAVRAAVTHHHERWDGRGYPDGLAGEAIPLIARIVACCDALDAMTTTRSYRASLLTTEAVRRLRAAAATQLDPRLAECLARWVEAHGLPHTPPQAAQAAADATAGAGPSYLA